MTQAFPVVNPTGDSPPRTTALAINSAMRGKINAIAQVTLAAGAATTVLSDPRIGVNSWIGFDPVTANAAVELAAGTLYILAANRSTGTATLTHSVGISVDRTYRVLIIG